MNQYALERIKEFSTLAEQFQELWKTILIRAAWFEAEGAPRLLVLSIRFKPEDSSAYPKPSIIPEVGPYKIAWEARPIAALKPTLVELAQGKINVEGVILKLEYKSGSNWQETGSLFVAFECPGAYNPHDGAFAQLFMNSGDSATDQLYAPVTDRLIEAQWRSLPAPFWNRQDVMRNFFEITWGDQNQVAVHAGGSIPISFDGGTRVVVEKLEMGISLPSGADPKKVSVGMIAALISPGPDLRSEIRLRIGKSRRVGGNSSQQLTWARRIVELCCFFVMVGRQWSASI